MRLSDKTNNSPIPYRDSKLTRVLRPSLEGNTRISIICNISPSSDAYDETLSTLKFAQRAKKIKQTITKNEPQSSKMLILKYENEIATLQQKLKEMEQKVTTDQPSYLESEIGAIKEKLSIEITEKNKLTEAFEQAMSEKSELEAEIAKLKSRILVSENMQIGPTELNNRNAVPMDRRIFRLTMSRENSEDICENDLRQRTSSILASNQEEFFRKTLDSPEQFANLNKTLAQVESQSMDFIDQFSVRDTMLLDKIDNINDLFDGFNPRLSSFSGLKDSFSALKIQDTDKNEPTRDQLLAIVADQDQIITALQKDNKDKTDEIESLKEELNLCRNNIKGIQMQLKELKKLKGK